MIGTVGVGEASFGQHFRVAATGQPAPIAGQRIGRGLPLTRRQQRAEFGAHALALFVEGVQQRVPVGVTQTQRDAGAVQRIGGQAVGLRVAQHLQAVFHPAQEAIRGGQVVAIGFGHLPRFDQRAQRRQQATFAQRGFAPATDQLQSLRKEFDLADAAGAALDVIQPVLARDFGGDGRLHLAQAVQRGEIQIAAVDERPQRLQPRFTGGDVTGHRARLDPRIALPVAAFALEILVHAGEGQGHPPGGAERTQAQIDAVAEAFGGGFIEQPRQALAEPGEVLLGGQRAGAIGLPAVRVGVDQVDVGGEVQLTAAQLAQTEHHQPLRRAVGVTHHTVAAGELLFQRDQRQLQAVLGQHRGAGQGGIDVVGAAEVAPDQPGRRRRAVTAQLGRPGAGLQRVQFGLRHRDRIGLGQHGQQLRLPAQGVDGEIAGHRQLAQAGLEIRGLRPERGVRQGQFEAGDGTVDDRRDRFRQGGGGQIHAVDSGIWPWLRSPSPANGH
ncbi:hypothetical protein D3C71_1112440 [compost metagenome]